MHTIEGVWFISKASWMDGGGECTAYGSILLQTHWAESSFNSPDDGLNSTVRPLSLSVYILRLTRSSANEYTLD